MTVLKWLHCVVSPVDHDGGNLSRRDSDGNEFGRTACSQRYGIPFCQRAARTSAGLHRRHPIAHCGLLGILVDQGATGGLGGGDRHGRRLAGDSATPTRSATNNRRPRATEIAELLSTSSQTANRLRHDPRMVT